VRIIHIALHFLLIRLGDPIHSFIHCGYFYSAFSSSLLLTRRSRLQHWYCVGARRSATSNHEWRTCPRSLRRG